MDFIVQYLSFFVIQTEGEAAGAGKRYKHYQTLDGEDYEDTELKTFLDGEFARIVKRKAERNPLSENVPTKIGRFTVEPGFELDSNPNYNLFKRLRQAESKEQFLNCGDELVRAYLDTSAVRGGALIIVRVRWYEVSDDPLIFVLKCDFEPKIARIADEKKLIAQVEMAISARNIKSIQYPHLPEDGAFDEWELKIHQASHARYFEDFLKYVSYEKTMPEVLNDHVMGMVGSYLEEQLQAPDLSEERQRELQIEAEKYEVWAASEKRELQEQWPHERVAQATQWIVEQKPDLELKLKLDGVLVKGKMADYGSRIHLARIGGRYAVLVTGDAFEFEHGVSPVELLQPEELEQVLRRLEEEPETQARAGLHLDRDDELPY
ncbi:hypothetical protein SD70_26920 [Gordoniibacillus kamchatkensis]|uniref:DUF3898 domain-containing protein n=1 Tax=Gordoniibacillus kamchatkensis TaxID=1590651 RepID=A0ABR5ACF4_9BACL|nr:DUF3900 domain-containing protein [Paenibacillus sp. VKM B-2647]KIL38358.1 hypothetical protein SD70_26920 [Paenibacillus sp. VKM B-2647]